MKIEEEGKMIQSYTTDDYPQWTLSKSHKSQIDYTLQYLFYMTILHRAIELCNRNKKTLLSNVC